MKTKFITPFILIAFISKAEAQQTVNQILTLNSNGVNATEILFKKLDNTSYYSLFADNLSFGLYNSTNNKKVLVANSDGNIGIGVQSPTQRLTVAGNINVEDPTGGNYLGFGVPLVNEYNAIGSLYSNAALTLSHGLKPHASLSGLIYSHPNMSRNAIVLGGFGENGIKFYTKGQSIETVGDVFIDAPKMILLNDGNVGIGTTAPTEKLHVNGSQLLNGNLTFASDQTAYFIKGSGNGGAIRIRSNASGDIDRNVQFGNVDNNRNWNSYMIVASSGNVEIGTATPAEKLAVNGKIRSKEVKVEVTNWPDYVFEDSYRPKTLAEIESFVEKNKHLPEVPSAKEVEKNGIELGEMNKILLKKIEELTLLLIEQSKRIEKLEKNK